MESIFITVWVLYLCMYFLSTQNNIWKKVFISMQLIIPKIFFKVCQINLIFSFLNSSSVIVVTIKIKDYHKQEIV